jgi:cytochrome c biogenesis protein CcdA
MPFLHQLAQGQVDLSLPIPVCDACQIANKRRFRKAFWKAYGMVFVLGVVVGFAVGGLSAIAVGGFFLAGGSLGGFLGGLVSLFIGWFVGRGAAQKAMPAQLERFLPKKGTVVIRFRRPEYAEQVLAANDGAPLQKAADDDPRLTTSCS